MVGDLQAERRHVFHPCRLRESDSGPDRWRRLGQEHRTTKTAMLEVMGDKVGREARMEAAGVGGRLEMI